MSQPDRGVRASAPVEAQRGHGEFEAVIRGLRPLAAQPWPDATPAGAVPLARVLGALVQSVADAQLAADVAAAKAVATAAEEPGGESSTWAAGVLPSFYQIAEIAVDVNLDLRFAPAGSPDAAVLSALVTNLNDDAGAAEATGAPVRVILRQVPPPAAVMANIPVAHTAATTIHVD